MEMSVTEGHFKNGLFFTDSIRISCVTCCFFGGVARCEKCLVVCCCFVVLFEVEFKSIHCHCSQAEFLNLMKSHQNILSFHLDIDHMYWIKASQPESQTFPLQKFRVSLQKVWRHSISK